MTGTLARARRRLERVWRFFSHEVWEARLSDLPSGQALGYRTARIVYYHRIDDEQHRSCVAPRDFAEQMAFLKREGFNVVPLAAVREPALVISTIAQKLKVAESGAQPLSDGLVHSLRDNQYKWSTLIQGIVQSNQFQMRAAAPTATGAQ